MLPRGGVLRVVAVDLKGGADGLAERGERGEVAERDGLEEDIADRRGLDRAGVDRAAGGAGGELIQERALLPPPTMCRRAMPRPVTSSISPSARR